LRGDARSLCPSAKTNSSPSAGAKGGAAPVRQGQAGVSKAKAAAKARGEVVVGEEITVKSSAGTRRVDLVTKKQSGEINGIEVKTGKSPYTKGQQAKDAAIASEGGVAVGKNAESAGIAGPIRFTTTLERY